MRWPWSARNPGGNPRGRGLPRDQGGGSRPSADRTDWRSYDAVAREYLRVHAPYTAVVARDLLDGVQGIRLLDCGTGTGDALEFAGEAGLAVGVDPSYGMLAAGRRPGRLVVGAEAINLPFADGTFDLVTANFSLAYMPKIDTALYDIRRVLRRGGRLVASAWGAEEDDLSRTWRELCEEAVGREILEAGLADEMPWARTLSDPARFDSVLRDAGFRPVHVEPRRYRFEIPREDYIVGLEVEAAGRYVRAMVGEELWAGFRARVRACFAERFPDPLIDFRDVLIASATRP